MGLIQLHAFDFVNAPAACLMHLLQIGAIGLRLKNWITYHGLSLNINPDMENYSYINSILGHSKIMAVVKANAYGHVIELVTKELYNSQIRFSCWLFINRHYENKYNAKFII